MLSSPILRLFVTSIHWNFSCVHKVRQVPEPVQPVPLRESPVDENTVGKPGYKFSLRGAEVDG